MFLILGTSECKFCYEAKRLLDENSLKYTYIDLSLKLDDWRSIFSILKSILGPQKTIPIIFKETEDASTVTELTLEELQRGRKLIGGFTDLKDYIEDQEITIDNY
jgi:glutaredoxin